MLEYCCIENKFCSYGCSEIKEDDPLVQKFTIYVQVLISQAMEPGFLRAVTEEKGTLYSQKLLVLF